MKSTGAAFVLAMVAASKPSDMLDPKAATQIENAAKRGERVNAEIDDDGNSWKNWILEMMMKKKVFMQIAYVNPKTCWKCLSFVGFPCLVSERTPIFIAGQ